MSTQDNHRTRWTEDEDAFLQSEWDGTRATAAVIAEILGRTPNAAAQRHYELTWGTAAEPVQIKPEQGATVIHVHHTSTTVVWVGEVCEDCRTVKSVSGTCLC